MMSQYGLPYEYDDQWLSGALELSIETLTGTAFEIRVSPSDTIMSIKLKIQRVEGIPISQQHLLYNLEELDNSASVSDYAIQNGATLKLVLSMRGGPINTRRLPHVDEMAWKELRELMGDGPQDYLFERLPSGSKVSVLVIRDGSQVKLFRVVENEDDASSPLAESWNRTSIRNLFTEEVPEESAKRLQENLVTMGKMQELKDKLESLSIQRKEKKTEEVDVSEAEEGDEEEEGACGVTAERKEEAAEWAPVEDVALGDVAGQQHYVKLVRRSQLEFVEAEEPEERSTQLLRRPLLTYSKAGISKARKEAENIIRMQAKPLTAETPNPFARAPLPEIRRGGPECQEEERRKTRPASRVTSSFAILEEENDVGAGPSLCTSQSSLVALPSNQQVAFAFSAMSRDRVSTTIGRSRYRVSRYVLNNNQRPKTTPSKRTGNMVEESEPSSDAQRVISMLPNMDIVNETIVRKEQIVSLPSTHPSSLPAPAPSQLLPPPTTKKKPRCLQCRKKLNITNKHSCRCGGTFCSSHRYSETHSCPFDYKEEGKKLLKKANPLIAASKLPKI